MDSMKLSIKLGPLEVAYEGSETFVASHLMDIIERLSSTELRNVVQLEGPPHSYSSGESENDQLSSRSESRSRLSTTDFAVKLGVKSGTDLVMAVAAYLHLTKGIEDLKRTEILSEMRAARSFYKPSYSSNLSKSLETLTKSGRLQNPRNETYALPYQEIEKMKMLL
jgi:hypothetical protein